MLVWVYAYIGVCLYGCTLVWVYACMGICLYGYVYSSNPGGDSTQPSSIAVEGKQYWAKGTGFGTGSFNSKWNMKETVTKQQQEEALVTILFEVWHHHGSIQCEHLPSCTFRC